MIVPVMAMLLVYYAGVGWGNQDNINQVNTINGLTETVGNMENPEEFHVVYGLHESTNYLVRSMAEINPNIRWVDSVFEAMTNDRTRLSGSVTSLVPEDAYIINYYLDEGALTLNLSREFLDYDPAYERQLLSSLVWSYTESEEVERVFFQIEGEPVNNLNSPFNVGNGLTRAMGINLEFETQSANSQQVLLYFLAGSSQNPYLVPVTRVVDASIDPVAYAVNALISGPQGAGYVSVLSHGTQLLEEPFLTEDGVLTLNFDQGLFFDQGRTQVSSVAIMQLVMTLTEQAGIDSVSVLVQDSSRVFDDNTRPIAVPATRTFVDPFVQAQ